MGKPSKAIQDFMEKYSVDSDEIWEVRSGGAWAIKHAALERVAAEQKIAFEPPTIIEAKSAEKIAAMCVVGIMGDRREWSIGEASQANCKNSYYYAMAEKRAKDRVALKLLSTGSGLYSDSEADDFTQQPQQQRQNPHVTRPEDIVPAVEYDEYGHPVDNIPRGDERIEQLPKAKAKTDFAVAQQELYAIKTLPALKAWGDANANRIESYPSDWQEILRGIYGEHRDSLRQNGKAA